MKPRRIDCEKKRRGRILDGCEKEIEEIAGQKSRTIRINTINRIYGNTIQTFKLDFQSEF